MVKNIIIVLLLVTNGVTLFYLFEDRDFKQPFTKPPVTEVRNREYHYRVVLKHGGVQKAVSIMKREKTTDLISKNQIITTLDNNSIERIEKVYHQATPQKQ